MKLIICEKSNVAKKIAKALKCTKSNNYYENNDYLIVNARGHLLELYDCKDYDDKFNIWQLDDFPYIPTVYKYKPIDETIKLLNTIKQLVERTDVTEIINAFDNDREGSNIYRTLHEYLEIKKPVYRILVNEWTPYEINKALHNMLTNEDSLPLQKAGECRQLTDWTIGINLTSAVTTKYTVGRGIPLSIGRVILPTLYLIYQRTYDIVNFSPETHYELESEFSFGENSFKGTLINNEGNKKFQENELNLIKGNILDKTAVVEDITKKNSSTSPKSLFNLSDLQGYITSKYDNWTSTKVLKVLQGIYENGYVSYPRTKSRHLESTQEFISQTKNVLNALKISEWYKQYTDEIIFTKSYKVFDSSKVESHGAIIPTYIVPNELNQDEKILYSEISKRFVSHFMPNSEYENTDITIKCEQHIFIAKYKKNIKEGWEKLYLSSKSKTVPYLKKLEKGRVSNCDVLEKQSSPPKPYTEKSLLTAMEVCGRKIDGDITSESNSDILRDVLEGYEIGTQGTRGAIIDRLIRSGYVERKGKSFKITKLGINTIKTLSFVSFIKPEFTGQIEKALNNISKNKLSAEVFMKKIHDLVVRDVEKIKSSPDFILKDYIKEEKELIEMNEIGKCPICKKPVIDSSKSFACSGWKEGCNFKIWKDNKFLEGYNAKIKKTDAKKLLESSEGTVIRANSTYINCRLIKDGSDYVVRCTIEDASKHEIGPCPKCGKPVIEGSKAFGCSDWKEGCDFKIWKTNKFLELFKTKVSKSLAKELLNNPGITRISIGSTFIDCKLVQNNGNYYPDFKVDESEKKGLGICPDCKGKVIISKSSYKCENNCGFTIWKNNFKLKEYKKKLSESIVKKLLSDRKIPIKGLTSPRTQTKFDAELELVKKNDKWYVNIVFDYN
ncbi:MAG: DNA topoisomerase [Tissierellales bacterium]|jgi:DNA topoisomerase-3|nr:DNA topoisomerase [Tissierellales bacterium]